MSQTTRADLLLGAQEKKGENWDLEIKSVRMFPHEQLGILQGPTLIQMHSKQTWSILLMKAIQLLKS